MHCPRCHFANPAGADRCQQCHAVLELPDATISGSGQSGAGAVSMEVSASGVQPGNVLAGRYEILQLLGEGGMGAVYKARDRELDRLVALKVIRPELTGRPEILQRFKQELILARQVTHKNVNRIFDLGEGNSTKFITMEYVDGQNLKMLLEQRGTFSPEEAAVIIKQICRALEAAHSEGIVHRDLKPHNIMVDKQNRVSVMDFGLAHSMELTGFTQTGALLGTPEYMSPEQAKGEKVDQRSDLFALGIIFYELLTGDSPYKADTPYATLLKRTQEKSPPPCKLNPRIPQFLSDVVVKCLQIDPRLRYQSAQEILDDLESERRPRVASHLSLLPSRLRSAVSSRKRLVAAVAALLLAVAASVPLRKALFKAPGTGSAPVEPVSLAILPFHNASGDQSLDWLGSGLADMLATDVGQSAHLRTVSSDRLHQILKDLRISPASTLDSMTLERLGQFSNAQVLVWGKYLKLGEQIRIDATLQDLERQRSVPLKAEVPSEDKLLQAVNQLAKAIQDNLAFSPDIRKELQAKSFQPSTQSLPALRSYNEGLALARQGKPLEAAKQFQASIEADPEFALAYAKLGQTYAALGYQNRAEEYARQAVDLSANLPSPEKYWVVANEARIANEHQKAIEAYDNLAKIYPADPAIDFQLGQVYEATGAYDQAREYYAKVLKIDPNYPEGLYAAARLEIKAHNPQGSLDYLNRALTLAIQLDNSESKAMILHAMGVAYSRLSKPEDALRYYQESLAIKRQIGDKWGMAASLSMMGQVYQALGDPDRAGANYEEALKIQREIGDQRSLAATLMSLGGLRQDRGQYDQALRLLKEALQIQLELGDENYQALCQSNIGGIYFQKGQYDDALTYYHRALQLREKLKIPQEMAETLYNLGETYARIGQYDQGLTHYLRALEFWRQADDKRGEAITSYGMGTLFVYQGRYGAALNASEEALKTLQQLQERGPWLAEIQTGYGRTLSLIGRSEEAQQHLEEALALARELGNDPLVARVLLSQGDRLFYKGDLKSARALYQNALPVASRAKDRRLTLLAKLGLAKVDVKQGRSQAALNTLRGLAREADTLGLKYLSAECSIYLGEALLKAKEYSGARRELESALRRSENMGLRALLAQSHFLLSKALPYTGDRAGARRHQQEASKLAEEMHNEARSDGLLQREDLRPIYEESVRLSGNTPS